MDYNSKYEGAEVDALLDKVNEDYEVKSYADYADYNADTSRDNNTISFVAQDNSIWVQGKQYSMNAGCYMGSNEAAVSTTAWYLAGEATLAVGNDLNIIGSVQRTLGNVSVLNNAPYNGTGIFVLSIRSNSESATAVSRFQWLTKVGQTPNLRVVISGYNVKLYCQVAGGQYHFARVSIFNQAGRITLNSKVLMMLSDNTTPETTDPVGTDISDVPYLLKSGGTVTGTVAFKEWVYNSKPINNKQGEYVHIAYNTRGTAGYVKVATITINYGYADEPIYFEIMQRQQPLAKLRLQYTTAGNTNPSLSRFEYQGTSVNYYYLHQTGSSVWDLYVRKFDAWTAITVSKVYIGGYSNGFYQSAHFSITWQDELVTAVPEGSVAATKATEYVNISGTADNAGKVLQTNATSSAERRVLLGESHETTQQDRVYKSSGLTYNPNTKTLTVPQVNGNAATATKLQTPRSFNLGGGLQGTAVNFDGTGNVELEGGLKSGYTARWADTLDEKLFARFFSIGSKAIPTQWQNTNYVAVLLITSSSNPNAGGILNVSVRKNGSGSNSTVSLEWLCKFSDFNSPSIYIGFNNAPDETYLDLFIKEGQVWQNFEITLLRSGIRGLDNSTNEFYLYNANYSPTGTTTEHYESVADAGKVIHGHTDDAGYSSASTTSYGITIKGWSQKTDTVRQAVSTGDYKRRVLLGGDNDNEEYLSTYKSRLLTYNPAKGEFEITDTASSFILSPTSPWFKLPTAVWDRGFWLKYGDTSLGRLIGAKGEVSDIEYYYIGGTFTNPDFKFNPDTKTMEGNVLGNLQATSGNEVFIGNQGGAGASTNDTIWINYRDAVGSQTMNDSTPLAHYYFGNRKGGHSGVYLHAARFKGIADTADKLQTARKIGFANFDGSANVSLNNIQGAFNARWTNNTTQWLRIIRFKTKTIYTRKQLILAVYDTEGSSFSGIIEVTLTVGAQLTTTYAFVNWLSLWAAPNYNYKGMFKITATYPTDNDEYVYLDVYANSPYTYKTINFCVLSCNDAYELTIGNSNGLVEGSALQNVVYQSTTDTSLVTKQSLFATDSAFLQSLEGLCHKSQDSSLDLRRRIEYICGQQVLSDTEEAGKAFYGSSANPLVISVPLKDPADAVAGGKVNINLVRYYYSENYWHEVSYGVNTSYTYTRWVVNGTAWPWHRIMKEGVNIEYDAWVTKATNATNADVATKTKYPIVFKRNGASITNWFADTTFTIDIPEELLGYSAPTGIVLKVPEISVANEAKKVSYDLEIKVNGVQQVSFDGSSAKTINIRANKTHFVKAANYGNGWTTPTAGATTPGIPLVLDTSFMIPLGQLMDGDTIIMQVPNTLTSTSTYPVYLQLDATEGIVTGNIVKIIKAQNAGTPVEWKGTTALTAGYYHFVYSEGAGGLIFMYRNVATS